MADANQSAGNQSAGKGPVEGFDQTNGLAGDLQGDDDGAEPTDKPNRPLIGGMIDHAFNIPNNDEDTSEDGYSEEGRP